MATAAWLAASQKAATEPAFLLSIYDGTNTFRCLSRSCTSLTDPVAITNIDSVASEIDPLTRATSVGECVVDVLDAWARPIVANYRLRGKKATIKFGFADLAEADFDGLFAGEISNVEPIDGQTVRFTLTNVLSLLDADIWGSWADTHPTSLLYGGGVGALTLAGIPDAMINAASFARNLCNGTWRAPLSVNRAASSGSSMGGLWSKPIKARDLINDVCNVLRASIVPDGDGVVSLVFSDGGAAVDNWTADDWIPGTLHQTETDGNAINRVIVNHGIGASGDLEHVYQDDDTTSQTALAFPGSATRVMEYSFDTQIVNGSTILPAQLLYTASTLELQADPLGMPGMAGQYPTQTAAYCVTASGPGYMVIGRVGDNSNDEMVTATAQTYANETVTHNTPAQPGMTLTYTTTYSSLTYTITRGASPKTHAPGEVARDITALYGCANIILARWKYGIPIVELETPLHKAWVGLGAIVTITDATILAYGLDGVTSSVKWGVIKKEVKPFASPPSIGWTLAYIDSSATAGARAWGYAETMPGPYYGGAASASEEAVSRTYVVSGYTITVTSGLTASIAAGAASAGTTKINLPANYSHTFTASKDTYVTLSATNGALGFYPVANGATAPTKSSRETWIAKVVTNATDITAITDMRTTQPTNLDKVGDGSTWKKVGGVDASNKATSSSIGGGAVGVHQSAGYDKRKSTSRNSSFGQWTRG